MSSVSVLKPRPCHVSFGIDGHAVVSCAAYPAFSKYAMTETQKSTTSDERGSPALQRQRHSTRSEAPLEPDVAEMARQSAMARQSVESPETHLNSTPIGPDDKTLHAAIASSAAADSTIGRRPVDSAAIDLKLTQDQSGALNDAPPSPANSAILSLAPPDDSHSGDSRLDDESATASHAPAQVIRPQPIRSAPCSPPLSPSTQQDSGLGKAVSNTSTASGQAATFPPVSSGSPPQFTASSSLSADIR